MSVAVVTGAAGGIGRAICEHLVERGERVVAVDRSDRLAELDNVTAVQVDINSDSGLEQVAAVIGTERVRLLVNNAGITRDARLVNLTPEAFAAVLEVNLGGAYRLTRRLVPRMAEGSSIVSMASRAYLGNFGQFNYSMSKGGLVGMTRALAIELAPTIRANAIAPGLIGTEMALGIPPEVRERMVSAIPLRRMGEPREVAEVVAFLSDAAYITGEVVVVGGGRSLT